MADNLLSDNRAFDSGLCPQSNQSGHRTEIALFLTSTVISVLLATLTIIGNVIVIYLAGRTRYGEALRYLNKPVRSLAVTDLLFGTLGIPFILAYYALG